VPNFLTARWQRRKSDDADLSLRRPDWSQSTSSPPLRTVYGIMASAGVEGALSSLLELTAVVT
jgi:hypothetical protein